MTPNNYFDAPILAEAPPKSRPPATGQRAIQCRIIKRTEAAILVETDSTLTTGWYPLSQVGYIKQSPNLSQPVEEKGFIDIIHVSNWLLVKKGFL